MISNKYCTFTNKEWVMKKVFLITSAVVLTGVSSAGEIPVGGKKPAQATAALVGSVRYQKVSVLDFFQEKKKKEEEEKKKK